MADKTENLMEDKWLVWGQRVLALAQSGLTYTKDAYEIDRFTELQKLGHEILAEHAGLDYPEIANFYANERGYATPKVDVRGAVFQDNKILLIQERVDNRWAMPGGWADVGLTPGEAVVKEVYEEAGLEVKPVKLLAVLDRRRHGHPPGPFYLYKIIIQCEIIAGTPLPGSETLDAAFFDRHQLPELSTGRTTESQIHQVFEYLENPYKQSVFD